MNPASSFCIIIIDFIVFNPGRRVITHYSTSKFSPTKIGHSSTSATCQCESFQNSSTIFARLKQHNGFFIGILWLTAINDGNIHPFCACKINILAGKPAEEIVRFVHDQGADLIIMGSQGKGSMNRWDISNIADKVIKTANVPVLLVRPGAGFKETKPKRKGIAT